MLNSILVYVQFKEALSQKKVCLTLEEENVVMESGKHARRAFLLGWCVAGYVAGIAAWLGTRRLPNVLQLPQVGDWGSIFRTTFTMTSATVGGGYGIQHSFGSSFEQILNQEGTQIQQELGNVLVNVVEKFPLTTENIMKHHVSKHFYLEKVFDDLSTDGPKRVWRCRNFFGDGACTSQRTSQSGSYSEITDVELKLITESTPQREDTEDAASSTMSRRRHKRSRKRSHRRLISRREASTNMQHALADKGMALI